MIGLNFLSIFFFSVAFTAGQSSGSLNENFQTLFQNSFEIINKTGIFIKDNFIDVYGNGQGYAYDYQIDEIIILMAKGTSRLTGIDSNYIVEILNGRNPPPFQSQLSCIKDGLMEMRNVVVNERNVARFLKKSYKKPKRNTKTCEDFTNYVMPHYLKLNEIYIPAVEIFRVYIPIFESLNMLDLFADFWMGKTKADLGSTGIVAADLAHGIQQEGFDYFNGISNNLTYPLSCIRDILDAGIAAIKSGYGAILTECRK